MNIQKPIGFFGLHEYSKTRTFVQKLINDL